MRVPRPQRYRFHGPASLSVWFPPFSPSSLSHIGVTLNPALRILGACSQTWQPSAHNRSSSALPRPRLSPDTGSCIPLPRVRSHFSGTFSKKPRTRFTDSASHLPSLFSLLYRPAPTGGSFIGSALPPSGPACPWSPSGIAETGGRRRPRPLSLTSGP